MDELKCTICGALVNNCMNDLEVHLDGHNAEYDPDDMADTLNYFDSIKQPLPQPTPAAYPGRMEEGYV